MLPILMGLLGAAMMGGGGLLSDQYRERKRQGVADQYRGLLGEAGGNTMGPADPEQGIAPGYQAGRGLMADPNDPRRQMDFAMGLMGLPGRQREGLQMFQAVAQNAQQADQFNRSENRLTNQFNESGRVQAEQFNRTQTRAESNDERQARQWLDAFNAQRTESGQRLGMERERLNMERARMNAGPAAGEGGGLPKLPSGFGYVPSASGIVAAPMPGTEPYAKAVESQSALTQTRANIASLRDLLEGKEQTVNGKKVRVGGAGTELTGPNSATYGQLRGAIIAGVANLRNMGVLQAGELETLNDQLPDPSAWGSAFRSNKSMGKAYEELDNQFKAKHAANLRAHPWLVPAPPAGFEVQQ